MLVLSRRPQESIVIGDEIEVTVLCFKGGGVRLGIKAPQHLRVTRKELLERDQKQSGDSGVSVLTETI